ncbi:DUF4376 domain-containing protein [Bacillus sp. Bos-x628]|uniref:DUF4376 domain-containing protein n=1 Tax=Bacillus maqinnsis TaxID=3229854 RepID=UPI00338F0E3D
MRIYLVANEDGTIFACGTTPVGENPVELFVEDGEDFLSNPTNYLYKDGVLVKDPNLELKTARREKVEELNAICNRMILSGFVHDGNEFQFTEVDQANFNQQLSLLLLDPTIDQILWKTENNGIKQFTREKFIDTCKAGESHKRKYIGRYWNLKAYVESLTDINAINNVNFLTDIDINVEVN